jgi:hypothetical protein
MEANKYIVIWFDDEFESLNLIKEKALLNGIYLKGFGNSKEGIEELERNLSLYDAAIVDGIFFRNPGQSGDAKNDNALFDVGMALQKNAERKVIPWFILSGQPSFTSEKNKFADVFKENKVYDKLKDEDLDALWHDLKLAADQQPDTQIRHKYPRVFELCSSAYIGEDASAVLLAAIKLIEGDHLDTNFKDSFNSLRKLVELLFKRLNQLGILPDGVFHAEGWINQSSRFLSGKHEKYLINEGVFHPIVCHLVFSILQITQDASHEVPEKLRLRVSQFEDEMQTPYLYISTLHQLFDVLIWFKNFIDNHPDPDKNKKLWSEIVHDPPPGEAWIPGMISRIADNGYATFQPLQGGVTLSIIPSKVREFKLNKNQQIEITTKLDLSGTKKLVEKIRPITEI